MIQDIFLVIAGVLTVTSSIPYLIDITKRKTKPRLVTWFNWTLLTGIATAAAISEGQWPSAVLTGAATITTASIVIMAIRYGDPKIEAFDVACQLAAIIGLILWLISNDAIIAILITVFVDFVAGLPTFKHAWQKPHEETSLAFVMGGTGAVFALLALSHPHLSGLVYPIYIVGANFTLVYLINFSPNRIKAKSTA